MLLMQYFFIVVFHIIYAIFLVSSIKIVGKLIFFSFFQSFFQFLLFNFILPVSLSSIIFSIIYENCQLICLCLCQYFIYYSFEIQSHLMTSNCVDQVYHLISKCAQDSLFSYFLLFLYLFVMTALNIKNQNLAPLKSRTVQLFKYTFMKQSIKEISVKQEERCEDSKVYCCFNPSCPFIYNRIFESGEHFQQDCCKKWIMSTNSFDYQSEEKFIKGNQFDHQSGTLFQFFQNPLSMIKSAAILQNLAETKTRQKFQSLRSQIDNFINVIEVNTRQKVRNLFGDARQIFSKMKILLKSTSLDSYAGSFRIAQFLSNQMYLIQNFKNTIFMNHKKINLSIQSIKKEIENIMENVICDKHPSNTTLNLLELRKLRQFLSCKGQFGKQLESMQKLFRIKTQVFIQNKNQQSKVQCPLSCEWSETFFCSTNKQSKKSAMDSLIQHILKQHEQEGLFYFSSRVTKKSKVQLTLKDIFYYMQKHDYETLQIVDRSSRFQFKQRFNRQSRNLTVQIADRYNKTLTNSYFIIAPNSQIVDTIIIALSYVVGSVYKKKIHLISSTKRCSSLFDFLKNEGIKITFTNLSLQNPLASGKLIKAQEEQTNVLDEEVSNSSQFTFNQ